MIYFIIGPKNFDFKKVRKYVQRIVNENLDCELLSV